MPDDENKPKRGGSKPGAKRGPYRQRGDKLNDPILPGKKNDPKGNPHPERKGPYDK